MKKIFEKVSFWISVNRKEFIILLLILVLGAFLRLYRISDYMTFLGDEGRDAIVIKRLLLDFDPVLVGPGTSIGNMYLGPLYYYIIAPSMLLSGISPVGPSVFVALMGVATIFAVWFIGREWFGKWAGAFASYLYAISPVVIIYSRSSWNPNIMPFFALISVYSLWRVLIHRQFKWMLIWGASFAFVLNSHYLGLLLVPTFFVLWVWSFISLRGEKKDRRRLLTFSILGGMLFLGLMSPLFIFDARHGFRNFNAIYKFFSERQTTVSARPWNALPYMWPIFEKLNTRIVSGMDALMGSIVSISILATLGLVIGAYRNFVKIAEKRNFLILFIWIFFALVGFGVYKQEIYDHYFGLLFPAPFLIIGGLMDYALERARIRGWWLCLTFLLFLSYFNFVSSPLRFPPNMQFSRTREIASQIMEKSQGEKFNLAIIAERNYEDAYQFFLEKWKSGVTDIDPQRADETITSQLFVVCELPSEKCDPTHNPKAEVANFGWSRIEDSWEYGGHTIYKLVHTQ